MVSERGLARHKAQRGKQERRSQGPESGDHAGIVRRRVPGDRDSRGGTAGGRTRAGKSPGQLQRLHPERFACSGFYRTHVARRWLRLRAYRFSIDVVGLGFYTRPGGLDCKLRLRETSGSATLEKIRGPV